MREGSLRPIMPFGNPSEREARDHVAACRAFAHGNYVTTLYGVLTI